VTNWAGSRPERAARGRSYRFFIGLTVMALCALIVLAVIVLTEGPVAFVIGLVFALLPVPFLVWGVLALDRYEPEPVRILVLTFVWGAGVATLIALVLNQVDQAWLTGALGRQGGHLATAVIAAPIVEECAKGLVILGMFKLSRFELDGPLDGIVYASAVGIGFAMTENVLYYSASVDHAGGGALLATFVLRGVLSPFAHPLFTSATGIGLGFAAISPRRSVRVLAPLCGLIIAVILHGIWNVAASASVLVLAIVYVCIFVPVFTAVLVIAILQRHRLQRLIRQHMGPYASAGMIGWEDVPMFASLGQRRRARAWARRSAGPVGARAMRDYQLTATELALLHDRAARGVAGPEFASHRQAMADQLVAYRHEFLRRIPAWPTQAPQMWPIPGPPPPQPPYTGG
jgi:RsiW-degrading membrane proteinase PrsW (M82 family)